MVIDSLHCSVAIDYQFQLEEFIKHLKLCRIVRIQYYLWVHETRRKAEEIVGNVKCGVQYILFRIDLILYGL